MKDMWRIVREGGFRNPNAKKEAGSVPRVACQIPGVLPGGLSLTWLGHATYLVQFGATRVLTDPVLRNRIPGVKRLTPVPLQIRDLPEIHAVVVSHNHYDHMDGPTLKALARANPACQFLVPLGTARWFKRRGLPVVERDWYESVEHAGIRFTATPVHHWTRRGLWDTNDALWCGWRMDKGKRVQFAGDTAYGKRFQETHERLGPADVAIMPIGAYEPRWFMQHVHMDPDEAVQATRDLGAPVLAAMHWGTFSLTRESLMEPLHRVRTAWERAELPREKLWDLALGETRLH